MTELNEHDPMSTEKPTVPSSPVGTFPIIGLLTGILGGCVGGILGYLIVDWVSGQGFYAMVIPGALIGLGFALGARKNHLVFGCVAAIMAFVGSILCEWHIFYSEQNSLGKFLQNMNELGVITWIMIGVGCFLAFSFARGRGV